MTVFNNTPHSLNEINNNVFSGGVSKDGIPPIEKPQYVAGHIADTYLLDNDIVFGLDFEGEVRIMDGDNDGTATVDMGADEIPYIIIDSDKDGSERGSRSGVLPRSRRRPARWRHGMGGAGTSRRHADRGRSPPVPNIDN